MEGVFKRFLIAAQKPQNFPNGAHFITLIYGECKEPDCPYKHTLDDVKVTVTPSCCMCTCRRNLLQMAQHAWAPAHIVKLRPL